MLYEVVFHSSSDLGRRRWDFSRYSVEFSSATAPDRSLSVGTWCCGLETATATIVGKGSKDLVRITLTILDGPSDSRSKTTTTVTATAGHPCWVPSLREWVDAGELKPGQWLQTSSGTWIQISAVEARTAKKATVHNLTVTDVHTYYVPAGATPVLAHNCGDAGYADVFFDDRKGHASIAVTHGGRTLHTEAGSREGEDSIGRVRTAQHAPGTIVIRVPLANARNARLAQEATEDHNFGPHDNQRRNCVTYCAMILRAGGVSIPDESSDNIAGRLLNSSYPQRRLR